IHFEGKTDSKEITIQISTSGNKGIKNVPRDFKLIIPGNSIQHTFINHKRVNLKEGLNLKYALMDEEVTYIPVHFTGQKMVIKIKLKP
ncbi:MAG: hypothetical protein ABI208_00765, partial [Ginsengibacter sp.]